MPRRYSALRALRNEWNSLVPRAQALGISGVRVLTTNHESIPAGQRRLAWLRSQLQTRGAGYVIQPSPRTQAPTVQAAPGEFTFGVELECILPAQYSRQDITDRAAARGVTVVHEIYNHDRRHHWKIVSDASIAAGSRGTGIEIVSPVLTGEDGFNQLRAICEVLTEMDVQVNRTCGFHVHVGARNQQAQFFRNLVRNYAASEPVIDTMVSLSRRGSANHYCQPVRVPAFLDDMDVSGVTQHTHSRYYKLNLLSYWRHGTVEFRQHQGTVDADKATHWVRFCLGLVRYSVNSTLTAPGFKALMAATGADEGFWNARREALR